MSSNTKTNKLNFSTLWSTPLLGHTNTKPIKWKIVIVQLELSWTLKTPNHHTIILPHHHTTTTYHYTTTTTNFLTSCRHSKKLKLGTQLKDGIKEDLLEKNLIPTPPSCSQNQAKHYSTPASYCLIVYYMFQSLSIILSKNINMAFFICQ